MIWKFRKDCVFFSIFFPSCSINFLCHQFLAIPPCITTASTNKIRFFSEAKLQSQQIPPQLNKGKNQGLTRHEIGPANGADCRWSNPATLVTTFVQAATNQSRTCIHFRISASAIALSNTDRMTLYKIQPESDSHEKIRITLSSWRSASRFSQAPSAAARSA